MMLEELFWKEGPGCFAGRPIILKFWHPKPKETHRWIPLWVKLYNVPVELWSPSGFSHIASAIGRPLHADSITESMQKVSFARICIEVDASKPLLDKFEVEISKDVFVEIHAFYQCKPKQCLTCLDTLTTNVQSPLKELEEGKQILETFEILPQLPLPLVQLLQWILLLSVLRGTVLHLRLSRKSYYFSFSCQKYF